MRIIAGALGGRIFDAPAGHKTHPMSDKARGGLFNALGDIEGLSVLDAFSGSGALSFEALSRGAEFATAIDIDQQAHDIIVKNSVALGVGASIKVIRVSVGSWSEQNQFARFDLVFCDPPYDKLQLPLLQKLTRHVKPEGLFVLSWPGKLTIPEFDSYNLMKNKDYGDAQLAFYRPSE